MHPKTINITVDIGAGVLSWIRARLHKFVKHLLILGFVYLGIVLLHVLVEPLLIGNLNSTTAYDDHLSTTQTILFNLTKRITTNRRWHLTRQI